MFCSECGQQNNDDARFCLKCGTPLAQAEEPAKVTSVIEEPAQQTNINSVADDNEPQVVSQKVIASPKEKSKKTKKKAAIVTVSIIIGIAAIILIGAVIVHRCYDCDKIIFYDQWREDSEISRVAVCKDCYDAYYHGQDNDDTLEVGYEIDDVILAFTNAVCANDEQLISDYLHPNAEAFREYAYDYFSEEDSVYVDCQMEAIDFIRKLNLEDIYFYDDTTCMLDQVYYKFENVSPVISEFENFMVSIGDNENVLDYAFVEFDVENSDCSISLDTIMIKTNSGWYLLAIDT